MVMAWWKQIRVHLISVLAIALVFTAGCSVQSEAAQDPSQLSTSDGVSPNPVASTSSDSFSNLPRLNGEATVELVVRGTPITLQLNGNDAPITAGNFADLVNRGVYNGLVFHRVVRQPEPFVVQGGDPQGADPAFPASQLGTGSFIDPATSAPRYVPLEIKPEGADTPLYSQTFQMARVSQPPALPHTRGALAMARSQSPDSASAQFYITLADLSFLDGSYAVFGYVTSGMDVVDQIEQGDRIESARIVDGLSNLQTPGA